ncbi:MAG: hypothetical protein U9R51_05660 [Actinomycetota bacterium]|nr:hypothetical protein [Actinomycetota bacterium]
MMIAEREQIYALLVEANSVSDPASVPELLEEPSLACPWFQGGARCEQENRHRWGHPRGTDEDGVISLLQASGIHVRDYVAFLMTIVVQLAHESYQPASSSALIECSGTSTDQLTEGAGLIVDATWTFKIDNGDIVRLNWRPPPDPRKRFKEKIGGWLPTAHPEIWTDPFALPERRRWSGEIPDCITGTSYATRATAAVLLEAVPKSMAEAPAFPLTG